MNRRELLQAIPGMYVNGSLASKVADDLLAKRALTRWPRQHGNLVNIRAHVIANELVLERTHLLELLTDPGWKTGSGSTAAKNAARDYIYRLVEPILLNPKFDDEQPEKKGE